jgi:hypothetical protein
VEDLERHIDNESDDHQPEHPPHYPAGAARSRPVPECARLARSVRRGHRVGCLRDVMVMMVMRLRREHPRLDAPAHVAAVVVATLAHMPPHKSFPFAR